MRYYLRGLIPFFLLIQVSLGFLPSALAARVYLAPHGVPQDDRYWVEEESGPDPHVTFIRPNEMRPFAYKKALFGRKGVLISVGSFRAYFDLVLGNFEEAIFLDIDPAIQEFHIVNMSVIAGLSQSQTGLSVSEQRKRYSLILLGEGRHSYASKRGNLDEPIEAKGSESSGSEEESDFASFEFKQDGASFVELSTLPKPLQGQIRQLKQILNTWQVADGIRNLSRYPENSAVYYWSSDAAWTKVQEMILSGRIYPVRASLTGRKSLSQIARVLRARGLQVSVLDVSNTLLSLDEWCFLTNLMALPWMPSSALLFTTQDRGSGMQELFGVNSLERKPIAPDEGEVIGWNYYAAYDFPFFGKHSFEEQRKILLWTIPMRVQFLAYEATHRYLNIGFKHWSKEEALVINPPEYELESMPAEQEKEIMFQINQRITHFSPVSKQMVEELKGLFSKE